MTSPPFVHDNDAVGDFKRLLLVVRDKHRRHMNLVVEVAQPAPQLLAHLGIERAERLVEQQHARFDGECARQPPNTSSIVKRLTLVKVFSCFLAT